MPHTSRATLAGVALAHAALLAVVLTAQRTPEPIVPPRPLTVSLIAPEIEYAAPEPAPRPPPPTPRIEPLPPPPLLAARPTAGASQPVVETSRPVPEPEPVPDVLPAPAPTVTAAPRSEPQSPPTPPRPADYLNNPKPPYPALSRRLGEEGTVRLSILVTPDGSVARLELATSSGHPRLDHSAIETVQARWKFEPARQNGKPVPAWVIVPIQFTLRS